MTPFRPSAAMHVSQAVKNQSTIPSAATSAPAAQASTTHVLVTSRFWSGPPQQHPTGARPAQRTNADPGPAPYDSHHEYYEQQTCNSYLPVGAIVYFVAFFKDSSAWTRDTVQSTRRTCTCAPSIPVPIHTRLFHLAYMNLIILIVLNLDCSTARSIRDRPEANRY